MTHYRPTDDEFFQGFEYEYQPLNETEWKKSTYENIIITENTRVKHLDKNDIISLGFTIVKEYDDGKPTVVFSKNVIGSTPMYYTLYLTYSLGLPFITLNSSTGVRLITELHIKNINEFKWILNRYGIL